MSPRLSGIAFGVGGTLLCLFLIVKIEQLLQDENSRLHKWAARRKRKQEEKHKIAALQVFTRFFHDQMEKDRTRQ